MTQAHGTMLAARAYAGEERFRLERIPVPAIGPGDALVAVRSTGITRGLLSLWAKGRIRLLPATLGHEIAGVVASIGAEAQGIVVGDRVRVHSPLTLRNDAYLQRDDEAASPAVCVIGHAIYGDGAMSLYEQYHNGGLAEYVKVPWWSLDVLDPSVSFDVGARIHSLAIAWRLQP